jgi:uridylate kinase
MLQAFSAFFETLLGLLPKPLPNFDFEPFNHLLLKQGVKLLNRFCLYNSASLAYKSFQFSPKIGVIEMFDLFEKWDGNPKPESSSSSSSASSSTSSSSVYSSPQGGQYVGSASRSRIFVLSVGGSVFFNEKLRAPEIAKFCEVINELKHEGFEFVIVVGGGRVARVYQAGAKALGANNFDLDEVAIQITRANAMLFTHIIDNAWKEVLDDPKKAENVLLLGKTPVFGGTTPGQTTDAVGAIIAEMMNAEFINLSNVDGIYSADPNKEPNAKMYKELSHVKMVSLLKAEASKPGGHSFLDAHAANIINRSKIRSFFVSGTDFENFKNCVRGLEFKGTIVQTVSASTNEAVE